MHLAPPSEAEARRWVDALAHILAPFERELSLARQLIGIHSGAMSVPMFAAGRRPVPSKALFLVHDARGRDAVLTLLAPPPGAPLPLLAAPAANGFPAFAASAHTSATGSPAASMAATAAALAAAASAAAAAGALRQIMELLMHPFVWPVLGVEFHAAQQRVSVLRPLASQGSLRDYLRSGDAQARLGALSQCSTPLPASQLLSSSRHQSERQRRSCARVASRHLWAVPPTCCAWWRALCVSQGEYLDKYRLPGRSLPLVELRRFGRQIMEALAFLQVWPPPPPLHLATAVATGVAPQRQQLHPHAGCLSASFRIRLIFLWIHHQQQGERCPAPAIAPGARCARLPRARGQCLCARQRRFPLARSGRERAARTAGARRAGRALPGSRGAGTAALRDGVWCSAAAQWTQPAGCEA